MPKQTPANLRFSSYANFRDPNFNQVQQFLGQAGTLDATRTDIAAEDRAQRLQIFERGLSEQTSARQSADARGQQQIDILSGRLDFERDQFSQTFGEQQRVNQSNLDRAKLEFDNLKQLYEQISPQFANMFQLA